MVVRVAKVDPNPYALILKTEARRPPPTAPAAAETTKMSPDFTFATCSIPIKAVMPVEPPSSPRCTQHF